MLEWHALSKRETSFFVGQNMTPPKYDEVKVCPSLDVSRDRLKSSGCTTSGFSLVQRGVSPPVC
jgi:hypothetical protein